MSEPQLMPLFPQKTLLWFWQTRWGPKCRRLTGGRVKKLRASFIKQKLTHIQKTKSPGKPKTRVSTKELEQSKSLKSEGTKNRNIPMGRHRRRHWWWTQSGVTGEDRRRRNDLTKTWRRTKTIYRHTDEGIRHRWSEAGKKDRRGKGTQKHQEEEQKIKTGHNFKIKQEARECKHLGS